MPADIINLRQARKKKNRSEREETAAANRQKFGRTKAQKSLTQARTEKAARDLAGHRLRSDDDDQK